MSDQHPESPKKAGYPSKLVLATGVVAVLLAVLYAHYFVNNSKVDLEVNGGQIASGAVVKAITPQEASQNEPYEMIIKIIRYEEAIAKPRDVVFKAYLNEFQVRLGNELIKKRMPSATSDLKTTQQIESQAATDAMLRTGMIFNDYNAKVKAADQLHSVVIPAFRKFIPQNNAENIAKFIGSPTGKKMLETGPQIDSSTMNQSIRYLESVAVLIRNQIAEEDNWPELKTEFTRKLEEPVVPEGAKMESIQRISDKLDVLGQARRWVASQAANYVNAWESSYKNGLEPGTEPDQATQARIASFKKKFVERLPERTDMQRIANIGYALQASSYTEEELKAIEAFWTSESGSIYIAALPQIGVEVKKDFAALTGRIIDQIKEQHPVDGSKDLN